MLSPADLLLIWKEKRNLSIINTNIVKNEENVKTNVNYAQKRIDFVTKM